jgi:uracil-DNA glycosylase
MGKATGASVASVLTPEMGIAQLVAVCRGCQACGLAQLPNGRIQTGGRSGRSSLTKGYPSRVDYFFVVELRDPSAEVRSNSRHFRQPPLYGTAVQQFFLSALKIADIKLADCWFTPVTFCHPLRTWSKVGDPHIRACRARVHQEISLMDPTLVIALGTKALTSLYRGTSRPNIEAHEGKILPCSIEGVFRPFDVPVLVARSPVNMRRSPDLRQFGNTEVFHTYLREAALSVRALGKIRQDI